MKNSCSNKGDTGVPTDQVGPFWGRFSVCLCVCEEEFTCSHVLHM